MLYGDRDEVIAKVREALRVACYFAWDVVKESTANTAAQERLKYFVELVLVDLELPVVESELPLHGTINSCKLALVVIPKLCDVYENGVLGKKRIRLAKTFSAKLDFLLNSIPKTKTELKQRYPELFPAKRKRGVK